MAVAMLTSLVLDALFPKFCLRCNQPGVYWCAACLQATVLTPRQLCIGCGAGSLFGETCKRGRQSTHLHGMIAALEYEQPAVRRALWALKFHGVAELHESLARLLIAQLEQTLPSSLGAFAAVVPIPLHRRRLRERGFNQAELLATRVGQHFGWPVVTDVLVRTRYTQPQSGVANPAERARNLAGAFVAHTAAVSIVPGRVLLIDDVSTTGATFMQAAIALRAAGVQEIWAAAVARGGQSLI